MPGFQAKLSLYTELSPNIVPAVPFRDLISGSNDEGTYVTSPASPDSPTRGYQQVDIGPSVHALLLLLLDIFSTTKAKTDSLTSV